MSAHPTTKQHIVIFKGDGWSQAEDYQKLYQPYDGVTLEFSKGYHLDIARKDTLDNQELRLAMIAEMRGYDGSFDAVDFKTVTHAHLEPTYKVVGRAALNQAA
jgi:glutamine cyclotransferase